MSRILNRQRQLAEQGRLRLGYMTEGRNNKMRPVGSETWIVTSHSEEYVRAAAGLWGGTVEQWQPQGNGAQQWRVFTEARQIDAILPPGDPLTQAYEMWNRGGCQRRCDGLTEQFSGSPCICLAEYGDRWFENDPTKVCVSKSRLKVILPEMPGLGAWRVETGSFYATDEIAGIVDAIRAAVGEQQLVPVRLRIEHRTRVAAGQTKQFMLPMVELRGATAGQILSGVVERQALASANQRQAIEASRPAIESGEQPSIEDAVANRTTVEDLRSLWELLSGQGRLDDRAKALITARVEELKAAAAESQPYTDPWASEQPAQPLTETPAAPGAAEQDPDAIWQQILTEAGKQGMTLPQVEQHFASRNAGLKPDSASAGELAYYLNELRKDAAA